MQERNLLYEKVLEILAADGWVNSSYMGAKCPYTLISAFWHADSILRIESKNWHGAFDHIREIIYNKYPERVNISGNRVLDFGGHDDTTYDDVVRVLQLAIGTVPSSPPNEQKQDRKIKFREWF